MKPYKTILRRDEDEFIINKSRFIGHAAPCACEQQALDFIGEMRARNHPSSPSSAIAHVICWNTESRSVLLNRRTTTAFASGCARRRRTMHTEMKLDFVEPRPPCSQ